MKGLLRVMTWNQVYPVDIGTFVDCLFKRVLKLDLIAFLKKAKDMS